MRFICEDGCNHEADFNEKETAVVICSECGDNMYADTNSS